jgi:hypothetical protein
MKLSAPKQGTFWVAVILALLGLVGSFVAIPVVSQYAFWLVVIGFIVLFLGNVMEGI